MATRVLTTTSDDVTRIIEDMSTIAVATTLTSAESGLVFTIPAAAAGAAITLPSVAKGLKYKFVVGGAFATTDWTIVAATDVIFGGAIVNSVNIPAATENTISLVASAETIGDWVEIVCDGTNWYVSGVGTSAGAITFTKP